MAEKDKSTVKGKGPKADAVFSDPNELGELLKDLDSYETHQKTELTFNSLNGDRMDIEKHKAADVLPDIYKDVQTPGQRSEITLDNIRVNPGDGQSKKIVDILEKSHDDGPDSAFTDIPKAVAALDDLDAIMIVASLEISDTQK